MRREGESPAGNDRLSRAWRPEKLCAPMNMSTNNGQAEQEIAPAPAPALIEGMEQMKAVALVIKAAALEAKRSEAAELRKEFIAMLPEATAEQFAVVLAAAAKDEEVPEGYRPNEDLRLTEEQKGKVKEAKDKRRDYCEANKASMINPLLAEPTQKLVALTVRQGKSKVTTTARFEKKLATSVESRGLLAKLAKATVGMVGKAD